MEPTMSQKVNVRILAMTLSILAPLAFSGCSAFSARLSSYLQCKAENRAAKEKYRLEELEALKQCLDAERRAITAEREMELAQQAADCNRKECKIRSQYEESIRTQLGLDLDQRVTFGQIQVNESELHELLKVREAAYNERMADYRDLKNAQARLQGERWLAAQSGGDHCACGTDRCVVPGPSCESPARPGYCGNCNLPKQPAFSNNCAGDRPFREAPTQPIKEPLIAAEIPMMLPVKIELGMTNSRMAASEVRRLPPTTRRSVGSPCEKCQSCLHGNTCEKPVAPSCELPSSPSVPTPAAATSSPDLPPIPMPTRTGLHPVPPATSKNLTEPEPDGSGKVRIASWEET
jgi:hypothetical protein